MRPPRRTIITTVLAVAVALVVAVPSTVWATHRFGDVPTGTELHEAVDRITDAGIVRGCGRRGNRFCPDRPVTRREMAQFFGRGLPSVAYGGSSGVTLEPKEEPDDPDNLLNTMTVDVGGLAGGTQYVKVDASITAFIVDDDPCPCTVGFYLRHTRPDPDSFSDVHGTTIARAGLTPQGTLVGVENISLTWTIPADTNGPETVQVWGRIEGGEGDVTAFAEMTATVTPFEAGIEVAPPPPAGGGAPAPLGAPPG